MVKKQLKRSDRKQLYGPIHFHKRRKKTAATITKIVKTTILLFQPLDKLQFI